MKNKIKELYQCYKQIDAPLQNFFYKNFLVCTIMLIVGICASIAFSNMTVFLLTCIASSILAFINIYRIFKCMEGDVFKIEGTCEELSGNFEKKYSINNILYHINKPIKTKRDFVVIKTDSNVYVKIYTSKRYVIQPGNQIVAYVPKNALFIQNQDTYIANILYFLFVNRRHS